MAHSDLDLWTCPKCGEKFTGANMSHSCGRYRLENLFMRCEPHVFETYRALEKMALEVAPFHIVPQKTRFVFQLRMRCVNGTPFKSYLRVGFILPKLIEQPRTVKIDTFSPVLHAHYVKLGSP